MVQEIIQYITWFIWPRRAATQMAKGVKTLDTRLCAPTYTRLMRTRNSKTQFNEENYRCFAPQLCPQPQKSKIRRVRDEVFLRAPTNCPNEISKGVPMKFCEDPDEIPNVILEGARRNFGRAPKNSERNFRRRPTKFCDGPDEIPNELPNEILEGARRI